MDRVLWAAWARVAAGSGMPGCDGVTVERYSRRVDQQVVHLGALLRSGEYQAQPLRPVVVQREGKQRTLGIASVRDRVAQRAFLEVAGRVLDADAVEASFAYRKGRSWLGALKQEPLDGGLVGGKDACGHEKVTEVTGGPARGQFVERGVGDLDVTSGHGAEDLRSF